MDIEKLFGIAKNLISVQKVETHTVTGLRRLLLRLNYEELESPLHIDFYELDSRSVGITVQYRDSYERLRILEANLESVGPGLIKEALDKCVERERAATAIVVEELSKHTLHFGR